MNPKKRIVWLDVARGYGMFLVFYGHYVEKVADLAHPGAFAQFKFIYAFHMPLFFVLSGLVARSEPGGILFTLRRGLLGRILPAVFFNLLLAAFWLPPFPLSETPAAQQIVPILLKLFAGRPVFNFLTWFLFCLFVVELIHALLRRFVRRDAAVAFSILVLLGLGQWITANLDLVAGWTGIPPNSWMIHEAIVAAGFHQLGFWLAHHHGALDWRPGRSALVATCLAAWVAVALTFGLNDGPFSWQKPVVLMALSSHGDPLLFPLTAILGSLGVATLAMLTSANEPARWIGRHSLVYLGLNAIFILASRAIVTTIIPWLSGPPLVNTLVYIAITVASLAITAPVALALTRGLPQLVGHPERQGPLLPALITRAKRPTTAPAEEAR